MNQLEKEKNLENDINNYGDMVLKVSFNYLKNIYDAEDICQKVFIKLYTTDTLFNSESHKKAWLIRVAINISKDELKSKRRKVIVYDDKIKNSIIFEKEDYILEQVLNLKPKYKIVIHLFYYEGYKTSEIANILKIKESTVRTRLKRGRELLKKELEGEL